MHRQASEAQSTLAQAHGTSSKMRSYFYPWERLTTERPNTMQLARCKMSSQAFSHRGKDLALQRDFWLKPRKPAYPPGLETQRATTGCSSVRLTRRLENKHYSEASERRWFRHHEL